MNYADWAISKREELPEMELSGNLVGVNFRKRYHTLFPIVDLTIMWTANDDNIQKNSVIVEADNFYDIINDMWCHNKLHIGAGIKVKIATIKGNTMPTLIPRYKLVEIITPECISSFPEYVCQNCKRSYGYDSSEYDDSCLFCKGKIVPIYFGVEG